MGIKLSFILRSPQLQSMRLRENVAVDILRGVAALEMKVDGSRCSWLRRCGQEEVLEQICSDADTDCEQPRWAITLRMLMTHTAGFGYDGSLYRRPPTVVHKAYAELAQD